MENPISIIKARVRLAISQGERPASLAKRAGLHRNSLYGCDKEDWNPSSLTLEKLLPFLPELAG